jgi:hypothetical protein
VRYGLNAEDGNRRAMLAFHAPPQLFLLPGVTSTDASHLKHFLFRHGRKAMRMPGKNEMLEFELNPGRSRCDVKSRGAR